MRQWHADPKRMCMKHLLGEHVEHHMFAGTLSKGKSVAGYIRGNLLEPLSLKSRHDAIAEEMEARGYSHHSPMPLVSLQKLSPEERQAKVDRAAALGDLLNRCPDCKARFDSEKKKTANK